MIPGNALSSIDLPAALLSPDDMAGAPLIDYERGGVALNDASQGLQVRQWRCTVDGANVNLQADEEAPTTIFSQPGIENISFTFDQLMRPAFAYTVGSTVYLRWYDSVPAAYVTTNYGTTIRDPRLCLDDKRATQYALSSDIIFAYLKGDSLCYRQQRDRFLTEYVLEVGLGAGIRLRNVGMTRGLRLQFDLQ